MYLGWVCVELETKTWPKHWRRSEILRYIAKFWTSKNNLELQSTHEKGTQITPSSIHSKSKLFLFEFGAKCLKLERKNLGHTYLMHIGKHNNEAMNGNEPILSQTSVLIWKRK